MSLSTVGDVLSEFIKRHIGIGEVIKPALAFSISQCHPRWHSKRRSSIVSKGSYYQADEVSIIESHGMGGSCSFLLENTASIRSSNLDIESSFILTKGCAVNVSACYPSKSVNVP